MTPEQFLAQYATGWTEGNVEKILGACASGYTLDDPAAPAPIIKEGFAEYFRGLQGLVVAKRQGVEKGPVVFMNLSRVLTGKEGEVLTASCWWEIPGTGISGTGWIEVGPEGVRLEDLCYHAKPAA